MIYATASVWLGLIVLLAWGVYHLWSGILQPKTVNGILLPGTLFAQLGRVVGLLITGATVHDTALMGNNDKGEPSTGPSVRPKIPFFGPIVVALLPMLAIGVAMFMAVVHLGGPILERMPPDGLAKVLPSGVAAFWEQLRALITLAEHTLEAARHTDAAAWKPLLLVYLLTCFSVRMAPLPGNARGHLGAIAAVGTIAALIGTLSPRPAAVIAEVWPVVSLATGWLVLLLLFSLVARGVVSAVQMIARLT